MEFIVNSVLNSITYILPVGSSHDCWLVDCGDIDRIVEQGWHVKGVLLTHAHFDHIYGLNRLMELSPNALVYTNAEGKEGLMSPRWNFSHYHDEVDDFVFFKPENVRVIEGEGRLMLEDGFMVDVLFTPGHEPSCIAFRTGDNLCTGDAYLPGTKVVTTFPRSNKQQAAESLARLQELERSGLKIMPGHWIENK